MLDVKICDPSVDEQWDHFVAGHPFGWICQMSVWKEILEASFKHLRPHYLCLKEKATGNIRAALPLFQVNSWITGNRLVSLPFATLCDPLVNSKDEFIHLSEAAKMLKEKTHCNYLEIRVFQAGKFVNDGLSCLQCNYKHHYIALNKSSQELKRSFHRTTVRQRIRKAEKVGLEVYEAQDETDLKEFYRLHINSRRRLCLPPHPYAFIQNIWQKLHSLNMISLLLAKKNDRNVAAVMCFKFKGRVSCEYSVVDDRYMHLRPNHLLFWNAIKNARQEGFSIFDFGRTPAQNKGLIDFKRRWGTREIDLIELLFPESMTCRHTDYGRFHRKVVMDLCKWVPGRAFLPLGNFFYRLLG
ncbi:MAG: GNAT family N-acetyltransferase [Desulfosarcina sp.]|nr:GNAT family N-acetyltransferase [Desulfobacterales bacterium]